MTPAGSEDDSPDEEILESPRPAKRRRLDPAPNDSSLPLPARWDQSPKTIVTYGRQKSHRVKKSSSIGTLDAAKAHSEAVTPERSDVGDDPEENTEDESARRRESAPPAEETIPETPARRKRGRPRKSVAAPPTEIQRFEHGGDEERVEGEDPIENGERSMTPTPTPTTRRSGRERRRPKRLSPQMEASGITSGRSTPATRGRGRGGSRAPRTVVSNSRQNGVRETGKSLGFTDIPNGFGSTPMLDTSMDVNGENEMVASVQETAEPTLPVKRKRGRPRKDEVRPRETSIQGTPQVDVPDVNGERSMVATVQDTAEPTPPTKRKRGRPRKDGSMPREVSGQRGPPEDAEIGEQDAGDGSGALEMNGLFARITRDFEPETVVDTLRKAVLEKLTGRRRLPLIGLDEEYRKIHQVVRQTVVAGEGNSLLVVGGRGTGKSTLVETVIDELSTEHRADFHVVRLNGFIHTDDKLALREIWRQLGREMEIDEGDGTKTTNYADTLSSLLALLSHPSELTGTLSSSHETTKSVIFILDEFDLFASHSRQTLLYNLFDIAQARKAPVAVLGLTTRIDVVEFLEKRVKSRFSHRQLHVSLPRSLPMFWEVCRAGLIISDEEADEMTRGLHVHEKYAVRLQRLIDVWNHAVDEIWEVDPWFTQLVQRIYHHSKSVQEVLSACILSFTGPASTTNDTHTSSGNINNKPNSNKHHQGQATMNDTLLPPDSKLSILSALSDLELSLLICSARLEIILDIGVCNFQMVWDEYMNVASKAKIQASVSSAGFSTATNLSGTFSSNVNGGMNASRGGGGGGGGGIGFRMWNKSTGLSAWETLARYELIIPNSIAAAGASFVGTGAGSGYGSGGGGGGGIGGRGVGSAGAERAGGGLTGGRREEMGPEGRMYRVDVSLEEILPALSSYPLTFLNHAGGRGGRGRRGDGSSGGGTTTTTGGISAVMAKWCREI